MSNQPSTDELRTSVERAVDLRARGCNWDQVAKTLEQKIETVRDWPHQFPEFWARRLAIAHRELDGETIGEARTILRRHLRSDNVKEACEIARVLFDHARRSQVPLAESEPTRESEYHQIADFLEGLSDEDRRAILEDEPADEPQGPGDDSRVQASGVGP
jgi:hypothetical protein